MKLLGFILIFSTASAIVFECEFLMKSQNRLPSTYFCYEMSISDEENKFLKAVDGEHERGKTILDVRGIDLNFERKGLDYFPKGMEKVFQNLTAIYVNGGKISKLNGYELSAWDNLEWFAMEHSQVEFVPGNLFSNNKKLKFISLYNNKIKHVSLEMFNGLNDLDYLSFHNNVCIHEAAENSSEIEKLKKNLSEKCKVDEELLCTQALTSTTKTCKIIQEQNQEMVTKLEKFNQEINLKLEKLSQENEEIKKILSEILDGLRTPTSA